MKKTVIFSILILICLGVMLLAAGIGSVFIPPLEIGKIMGARLFGMEFYSMPSEADSSIFINIRLPRVALAFIAGAALSVSGALMQSVLRNPLASSFTLGISSGAAVGASIAILLGASFFDILTLPFFGFTFGMLTVVLAVSLAAKMDKNMGNTTIILTGMAFSLFANAMISFLISWSKEGTERIIFWQMGSFALKDWTHVLILLPITMLGILIVLFFTEDMDIMTFGEEQAKASGVDTVKMKWTLLSIGAILTGCAVSMVGVIGFVDLFVPHGARRILGSRHRYVIPASAIMGGGFMVICDLIARTLTAPVELPVGAVTSAIGAPFFIYLYFNGKRGGKNAMHQ